MSMSQHGMTGMPMDQPGVYQDWQPPQKKGMGCGCQLLIGLAVLFVLLVVVCCGGGVWMGRHFATSTSKDPAVVNSVAAEIAQIDVPEEFKPVFSLDLKVPWSDRRIMAWVVYADEANNSGLVMALFGEMLGGRNRDQMWKQIEMSLEQQDLAPDQNQEQWDWEQQKKEIEVRGQPVTFNFAVGTKKDTGADEEGEAKKDVGVDEQGEAKEDVGADEEGEAKKDAGADEEVEVKEDAGAKEGPPAKQIIVNGAFEGKNGPVMLFFFGNAEKYDESRIVEIIESIR